MDMTKTKKAHLTRCTSNKNAYRNMCNKPKHRYEPWVNDIKTILQSIILKITILLFIIIKITILLEYTRLRHSTITEPFYGKKKILTYFQEPPLILKGTWHANNWIAKQKMQQIIILQLFFYNFPNTRSAKNKFGKFLYLPNGVDTDYYQREHKQIREKSTSQ